MNHHPDSATPVFSSPLRMLATAVIFLLAATAAAALEAPAAFEPPALQPEAAPTPRLLFEALALEPAELLAPAAEAAQAELAALASWNGGGRQPQKVGFVRPLARPLAVEIAGGQARSFAGESSRGLLQSSPEDGYTWVTRIEAADASRLRLRLRSLELAAGSELMVYNESGEVIRFGLELAGPDGELWTPSVAGPAIFLEIHAPASAAGSRFEIDAVSERFELDQDGQPLTGAAARAGRGVSTACLIDSACVTTGTLADIAAYRAAVARLVFSKDGDDYLCSGSLLNDLDTRTTIPYLLTANHCFSSQSSASSLEAFWDYHAASCGGAVPTLGSLPRSNGGTLLASSAGSDFTFLQLNSAPSGANGRVYLGWVGTSQPADGSSVYGLHHPMGEAQSYTRSSIDRTPSTCSGAPTSNFLYAHPEDGATFGGSSGSPITNMNLQVVGQLFGGCGPNADDPCSPGVNDFDVFGAFATTHSSLTTWLDATGPVPSCVDSATTLCLLNKRFKVEATYRTFSGQTGQAKAVRLTDETGYFWFFNATNIEAVFKLLNACTPSLGNHYWVFAGGLTDVEVTTTVTDTVASGAGSSKTYFNPLGTPFQPITDLTSFATCP